MHPTLSSVVTLNSRVMVYSLVCFSYQTMSSRQEPYVALNTHSIKVCKARKGTALHSFWYPSFIPLQAVRQAVAETVEALKMKPAMMNLVEE